MPLPVALRLYGQMPYATAWTLQRTLVQDRIEERIPDTLILLEHEPVFTIGRRGHSDHCDESVLLASGYPVFHVERGGSVTYHGPGQIVGYPILRLNRFCPGPKIYMQLLEEVIIRTLAAWNLPGARMKGLTGVWVGQEKIAAMGVRIIRGVTMHGFALNVSINLDPFDRIVPCGIAGCRVTSMSRLLDQPLEPWIVRKHLAHVFADVFDAQWIETTGSTETATSVTCREAADLPVAMRPAPDRAHVRGCDE
ncbi:MAG TPA: lipoyl(octanoyl) transferase LipB [Nitrospiraceae bacterium]|nr:lipoyl(octanoyl) transferase LipB [Nitrospiraceae bacterium]